MRTTEEGAADLLSAAAVRNRCRMIYDAGVGGKLPHFTLALDRLDDTAAFVAETIRLNYPTLTVPFHARWRHFVVNGVDRWQALVDAGGVSAAVHERARQRFELAITSVLLDAGAGAAWRWTEPVAGGGTFSIGRSEGLALASFAAWAAGHFSNDDSPRADAVALQKLSPKILAREFQVSESNPLEGVEGRAALLNRLGDAITASPELFGVEGRLGGLYDTLLKRAAGNRLPAPEILRLILEALGPIWPGRIALDGVSLGDAWRHPAIDVPGPTRGLVPFHKLSQWLSYSLIEPLQEAGIEVIDIDGLTGLAEYRNGGLFIDMGVIVARDSALLSRPLAPSEEPIVEWRALTVALLDEIAPRVRNILGKSAAEMPLASVLEGGTWSAGRRVARRLRPDTGNPPITIVSDGSVF